MRVVESCQHGPCRYWKKYGAYCDYCTMAGHLKGPQPTGVCALRHPLEEGEIAPTKRFANNVLFPNKAAVARVTKYEQVGAMVAQGKTDQEIAAELGYAAKTVAGIRLAQGKSLRRLRAYRVTDRATGAVLCEGGVKAVVEATGLSEPSVYSNARGTRRNAKYKIEVIEGGARRENTTKDLHRLQAPRA